MQVSEAGQKAYLLRLPHYVREVQSLRGVWSEAQSQGKDSDMLTNIQCAS